MVAHLQNKYFEAEAARESLLAKVEALEATAANLNASIVNACGNLGSAQSQAQKDGVADGDNVTPNGSIATQTSFLGDVQEQLKAFKNQFDSIKTTIQGEPESAEDESSNSLVWLS